MVEKFDFTDGVNFDPGFIQHLTAFTPNVNHIYSHLQYIKNFNQKKLTFKMYYPKLINLIDTYIGFYLGCMLWGACIKDLNKPILNNLCYSEKYNEAEILEEIRFMKEYLQQFTKDVRYYMGQNISIEDFKITILDEYENFLKINKGFTQAKSTLDIKINSTAKDLSQDEKDFILNEIAKVIETGNFKNLYPLKATLFKQTEVIK